MARQQPLLLWLTALSFASRAVSLSPQQCEHPEQWCPGGGSASDSTSLACTREQRLALKRSCCASCLNARGCTPFTYCYKCCFVVDGGWGEWGACTKRCGGGVQFRSCNKPAPRNGGAECVGGAVRECNTWSCLGVHFATPEAPYEGACHNEMGKRWRMACEQLAHAMADPDTGKRMRATVCRPGRDEFIRCAKTCGRCHKSAAELQKREAKEARCKNWGSHTVRQHCAQLATAIADRQKGAAVKRRFCRHGTPEFEHCRHACCVQPVCRFDACAAPRAMLMGSPAPTPRPTPSMRSAAANALLAASWFTAGGDTKTPGEKPTPAPWARPEPAVDGGWSAWGACDATCAPEDSWQFWGQRKRLTHAHDPSVVAPTQQRACNNPSPRDGGRMCRGAYKRYCTSLPVCPVHGSWGTWGACTRTCGGLENRAVRVRLCDAPAPAHGGRMCEGEAQGVCAVIPCPVNGGWGAWGDCTRSCGGGTERRRCDRPSPMYGGRPCAVSRPPAGRPPPAAGEDGVVVAARPCNTQACAVRVDGRWGSWGVCSATCGVGHQTRQCDRPAPQNGGAPCAGAASGWRRRCSDGACAVDGGWGAWTACTRTCGDGTQTRECDSPKPSAGGRYCDGPLQRMCGEQPCPIDGGWAAWGGCSKDCADVADEPGSARGFKVLPGVQARRCAAPKPAHGGRQCVGPRQRACNTRPCAQYVIAGGWGSWTACSKTCGAGLRKRLCDSPAPRGGGAPCAGKSWQFCNAAVCTKQDGGWGEWGACSLTCASRARGVQRRQCDSPAPKGGGLRCVGAPTRQCLGLADF
eukprot:g7555.t1